MSAEFGQPTRSATSDANQGIVNPPTVKAAVGEKAAVVKSNPSGLELGTEKLGLSLGKALEEYADGETSNINEQRVLDATMRQGTKQAINSIDQTSKRTGWTEAVFGQNIEYRAAQQRAVENGVSAAYLEQMTAVETFAGETPEEYSGRLKGSLDQLLEPHSEDFETKQKVTGAWAVAAAKLTATHHKSHFAYNQMQQRETTGQRVLQHFDISQIEVENASTPEELQSIRSSAMTVFASQNRPEGMSKMAYQSVVREQVETSLRAGNLGAYNLAGQAGFIDKLGAKDRVHINEAISAYDTKFSNAVSTTYEQAEMAAALAPDLQSARALWVQLMSDIDTHGIRSSGTERAELALARNKSGAAQRIKAIDDIGKKAIKAASAAEKKAVRVDSLKEGFRMGEIDRSAKFAEVGEGGAPKKGELEEALDSTIMEDLGDLTQMEETPTIMESVKILAENPAIARQIAQRVNGYETQSPMIKVLATQVTNGFHNMVDANGRPNTQAILALQSMSAFEEDTTKFKKTLGNEAYNKYQLVKRGVESGMTSDMIEKNIKSYEDNKGNKEKWGGQWPNKSSQTKSEYVADFMTPFTGGRKPIGRTLARYMEEYDDGLLIYSGDHKRAKEHAILAGKNNSVSYRGRTLFDEGELGNETHYNLPDLLDGIQKESINLLAGYIAKGAGITKRESGDPVRQLSDVKGWDITQTDGVPGFYIDAPSFQAPVYIPPEEMQMWEKLLDQDKKKVDMLKKADNETIMKAWKEEETMKRHMPHFVN